MSGKLAIKVRNTNSLKHLESVCFKNVRIDDW